MANPNIYALTDTRWSNAGTTYRGIWLDLNNGSGGAAVGAAASRSLRLSNNGTDFFGVDLAGNTYLASGANLNWNNDTFLFRDGSSGTIAQASGASAQKFSVYNTQISGVNYERATIDFQKFTNICTIGAEAATGTQRVVNWQSGGMTLASLPTPASVGSGARMYITDCTAPTFNVTVSGGGATPMVVWSNGTNWKVG